MKGDRMSAGSQPSTTRMVVTLAALAVGVIVVLLGVSAAMGAMTSTPAAKGPPPAALAVTATAPVSTTASAQAAAAAQRALSVTTTTAAAARREPKRPATAAAKPEPKAAPAAQSHAAPAKGKAAPAPKARHVAALPDKLKTLGGARQVVVVTSSNRSDRDGTLDLYDLGSDGNWTKVLTAPTRMGKNAMVAGTGRHQGSSMTPTGSWAMPKWGFGWASRPPSGSRLGWKQITSSSYWSAVKGPTYNTWVTSSHAIAGEHLRSAGPPYEFAIDSGYNAPPNSRVYGRGTAIFIHVMHPGYTAGCISLPRAKMIELLRRLDPARHPRCVVGTTDRGTSTSIWAY